MTVRRRYPLLGPKLKPLLIKSKNYSSEPGVTGGDKTSVPNEFSGPPRHDITSSMEVLSVGSTATVARVEPGLVLKSPHFSWWNSQHAKTYRAVRDIKHNLWVEEQILAKLGEHPRIIRQVNCTSLIHCILILLKVHRRSYKSTRTSIC